MLKMSHADAVRETPVMQWSARLDIRAGEQKAESLHATVGHAMAFCLANALVQLRANLLWMHTT
jgi:hypothetical protein